MEEQLLGLPRFYEIDGTRFFLTVFACGNEGQLWTACYADYQSNSLNNMYFEGSTPSEALTKLADVTRLNELLSI